MRVAAALSNLLVIGLLAVFAMGEVASADTLEVEPDAFPEGTVLNDKFPGVILSNQTLRGDPDETDVLVRSGFFVGNGVTPHKIKISHRQAPLCLVVNPLQRAHPLA